MRQLQLGNGSGPRASALCLGAMPLGSTVNEPTSFAILDRFVDAGGSFIDTANNYIFWTEGGTGNESEELLGRWFRSRGRRDQVVLASKVGGRPDPALSGPFPENAEGLSAKVIRAQVEASLRRLGTDRLDVYYAHIEDRAVPLEETMGAFADLVAEGKVGQLGCSNHPTWRLERARNVARQHGWPGYTCIQLRHSYLRPRPGVALNESGHRQVTDELLDYVRSEGDLTLTAYTTLLYGAYTRPDKQLAEYYDHPGTTRRLAVLREVAAELGATANQVVLAWLMGGDPPIVPVLGCTSVSQLDEGLGAADLELDAEHRRRLDGAG